MVDTSYKVKDEPLALLQPIRTPPSTLTNLKTCTFIWKLRMTVSFTLLLIIIYTERQN